jgi:hypothetical protein
MQELRRDLERRAVPSLRESRRGVAVSNIELARELHELVAALDRRVPRVERAGETDIAREAAALRAKALKRLGELSLQNGSAAVRPEPQAGKARPQEG